MDLLHPRCAGLDVSKRDAKACVRVASGTRAAARSTVTTWVSRAGFDGDHQATEDQGWQRSGSIPLSFGSERSG